MCDCDFALHWHERVISPESYDIQHLILSERISSGLAKIQNCVHVFVYLCRFWFKLSLDRIFRSETPGLSSKTSRALMIQEHNVCVCAGVSISVRLCFLFQDCLDSINWPLSQRFNTPPPAPWVWRTPPASSVRALHSWLHDVFPVGLCTLVVCRWKQVGETPNKVLNNWIYSVMRLNAAVINSFGKCARLQPAFYISTSVSVSFNIPRMPCN